MTKPFFKNKSKKKFFNKKKPVSQNQNTNLNDTSFLQKYDSLFAEYLDARKKYFEHSNRYQNSKTEKRYYEVLSNIRKWESSLAPWQRDIIEKKNNPYKLDSHYSKTHIDEQTLKSLSGDSRIHILRTQEIALANYREDFEESSGTIKDYLKYRSEKT